MPEFHPKIKHESYLTDPKPKIGDGYGAGVVVGHTIGGLDVCINQFTGITEKVRNCPVCPKKIHCKVARLLNIN